MISSVFFLFPDIDFSGIFIGENMKSRLYFVLLSALLIAMISCNSKKKNADDNVVPEQDEDIITDNNQNTNSDILSPTDQNSNTSTITEVFTTQEDEEGNVFIKDENGNKIIIGADSKAQFSFGLGDIVEGAELAIQSSALQCDSNSSPLCHCYQDINSAECAQFCNQHKDNQYCKNQCNQHPSLSFCSSSQQDGGNSQGHNDDDHLSWKEKFCQDYPQHGMCQNDDSDHHNYDDYDRHDKMCRDYPQLPSCHNYHDDADHEHSDDSDLRDEFCEDHPQNAVCKGHHHIDSDGLQFTVTSAKLNAAELNLKAVRLDACDKQKFKEKHSDLCSGNFTFDGPIVFDLIAETSSPTLDSLQIPAAPYKEILLPLEPLKTEGFDEKLMNHTAYIDGEFTYEGQNKKFIVRSDVSKDLHFKIDRSDHAIIVSPDVSNLFEIRMNPSQWFDGLPIEKCLKKGELTFDGDTLIIEDNKKPRELCKELGRKIIQNMIKSSKMRHH